MNPRGVNFEICLKAAKEVGYEDVVAELERIQYREEWVEYALELINMVQKLAERISGFEIHSWPDRELLNATRGETKQQLVAMGEAVSPESFGSLPSGSSVY